MPPRARRHHSSSAAEPFPGLPPLGEDIPTPTGTVRLLRESDGSVVVEVNGVPSSQLHPDPTHLVFEYMRWMFLVLEEWYREAPLPSLQVAHLGGGGCALPRAIAAFLPQSRQIVCELDAVLAEHAREWFSLPRSPQLRIRQADAAIALSTWRKDRFDVLIRDVFAGSQTPPGLIGREAAAAAGHVLRPGGLLLVNSASPQGSTRIADEAATLAEVFAHVGVIAEPAVIRGRRRGNTVLLASSAPLPAGIERRLRSDPVSVRLLPQADVDRLIAAGTVLDFPLRGDVPDRSAAEEHA